MKYPEIMGSIGTRQLISLFRTHTKCMNVFLLDGFYDLTSVEEAKKYSKDFLNTIEFEFDEENFNCNNYSIAFKSFWNKPKTHFPLGISYSLEHTFNVFVDHLQKIWIIEPQTLEFHSISDIVDDKKYWPLRFILF